MLKKICALIISVTFFVLQVPFFVLPVSAAADTCTWTGVTDGDWNDSANWTGCDNTNLPEDGDTLVFPNGPTNKTLNNDIVGLDLNSITISGDGYTITGNDISLSPSSSVLMQITGSNNDFGLNTTLNGSSSKSLSSSGANNAISGDLILNLTAGGDMNMGSSGSNTLTINGSISGNTDGFIISNGGTVEYNGASNFVASGVLQINQGAIASCGDNTCLGDSANDLLTYGDAKFITTGVRSLPYNIQTNTGTGNPIIEAKDTLTLTGLIDINTDTTISETNVAYKIVTASDGGINIDDNKTLNLLGGGTYLDSRYIIKGLSGTGDVSVTHGELSFNSNSGYDGDFIIKSGGFLNSPLQTGLGTTVGGIVIEDGGVLRNGIVGAVTLDDNITIEGAGNPSGYYGEAAIYNENDGLTFTGSVNLTNNATIINTSDASPIEFNGSITGTGDLTLNGDDTNGGIILSGSTANNYDGTTYINSINVTANKSADITAIPGDAVVTAVPAHTARIFTTSDEQIADDSSIELDTNASTGSLVISGGHHETVGTITGDGLIHLGSISDSLAVGGGNKSGVFTGEVLGGTNFYIHKVGTGTWDFQGTNWDLGGGFTNYDVSDGKLLLNPADTSLTDSLILVQDNGTVGGSGVIGPVNATGGTVSPGNSPGCLYPSSSVTFSSASSLKIEINNPTACTGYDKLIASGSVNLANATLTLAPGYTPDANTEFTIVEGSSVSGIFKGLADGSLVTANGLEFRINYTANSVKLTFIRRVLATTGNNSQNKLAGAVFLISTSSILGLAINKRRALKYLLIK